MRILFIINSGSLSGAEISALHLMRSLDPQRYALFLALPHQHKFPVATLKALGVVVLPFAKFSVSGNPIALFRYALNVMQCAFRLSRFVKANNIDVLYSNSEKAQVYGLMAKTLGGTKSVWHVRDNVKLTWIKGLLTRYSDRIVCVSTFVGTQFHRKFSGKLLLSNGIDTHLYAATPSTPQQAPRTVKTVTMVSQLTRWKNIGDFIRVAAIVKDAVPYVRFVIAGDCLTDSDRAYKAELYRMVRTEGLTDHVHWLGWVDNIREVYEQTDVMVHTAISEPFGRVVAEAMAMEIPVVAYNIGGPGEIVEDGVTGHLIEPGQYRAMGEKLIALLQAPQTRRAFGKNGRKRIQQKFELANHVQAVETALDGLLHNHF